MDKRNQLLTLLNEEINNINYDHTKLGWTIWALLAALATTIWLILNQFGQKLPDWTIIQIVLINISFIAYIIISTYRLLNFKSSTSDDSRYRTGSELFSNKSKSALLKIIWSIIILYFTYHNSSLISYLTYVLSAIIICQSIISSFLLWSLPFQKDLILFHDENSGVLMKTKINWLMNIFQTILIVTASYCLSEWLNISNLYNLNYILEFKMSILFFAIYLILIMIFSQFSSSRLLEDLIDIRRELVLTDKSEEQLKDEIDVAIKGHKIEKYTNSEFKNITKWLNNYHHEISQTKIKIEEFKIETNSNKIFSEEKYTDVLTHMAFAARIELNLIRNIIFQLRIKEQYLSFFSKHSELKVQIEKVLLMNDEYKIEYNKVVKEFYEYLSKSHGKQHAASMIFHINAFVKRSRFKIDTGDMIN